MTWLVAAAVFFVVIHIGVSGTGLRRGLVARIGEGPYMGLFSLASLGGMVWLARALAHPYLFGVRAGPF